MDSVLPTRRVFRCDVAPYEGRSHARPRPRVAAAHHARGRDAGGVKALDRRSVLAKHAGMIVRYKVRPIANIPLGWVTEITHCEEGQYFVDEQRFGPYRFWHHQHHFTSLADGRVRMTDIVHYDVGFGPLGRLMNRLYVASRLNDIFDFRASIIHDIFPHRLIAMRASRG